MQFCSRPPHVRGRRGRGLGSGIRHGPAGTYQDDGQTLNRSHPRAIENGQHHPFRAPVARGRTREIAARIRRGGVPLAEDREAPRIRLEPGSRPTPCPGRICRRGS
jgi:hypothetical protein